MNEASDFLFKIAETKEELEQAFQVLHDAYVEQGYMDPHRSGMRVTKYHALPTTTVLIAKDRKTGLVVGTISIVRNTPLGLPLDSAFSLAGIKSRYHHLAEVSSLAIRREYRLSPEDLLWPLLRYFYQFCVRAMKLDAYIIGVNPSWHDLYVGILGFEKISGLASKEYKFVKNAPVAAYLGDLFDQETKFYRDYAHLPERSNWFSYCIKGRLDPDLHQFPTQRFDSIQHPVMTAKLFNYFFAERTDALELMTSEEKRIIKNFYELNEFSISDSDVKFESAYSPRGTHRFLTRIHAKLAPGLLIYPDDIEILDCSKNGLKIFCTCDLPEEFELLLSLGPSDTASLRVSPKWRGQREYGLTILRSDPVWAEFIVDMDLRLKRKIA